MTQLLTTIGDDRVKNTESAKMGRAGKLLECCCLVDKVVGMVGEQHHVTGHGKGKGRSSASIGGRTVRKADSLGGFTVKTRPDCVGGETARTARGNCTDSVAAMLPKKVIRLVHRLRSPRPSLENLLCKIHALKPIFLKTRNMFGHAISADGRSGHPPGGLAPEAARTTSIVLMLIRPVSFFEETAPNFCL